jgi:beta-lactamase class D
LSARESEAQTRTIDKLTTEEFVNTNPNVAGGRGSASNVYRRMKWFVGWVERSKTIVAIATCDGFRKGSTHPAGLSYPIAISRIRPRC